MTRPRLLALLFLLPALLALTGCAPLVPNHVTLTLGRDEAETAGDRRTRTLTHRAAVSATYDLH